jgi:hypothetical protein
LPTRSLHDQRRIVEPGPAQHPELEDRVSLVMDANRRFCVRPAHARQTAGRSRAHNELRLDHKDIIDWQ